jgi:hypothetical protein
MTLQDRATTPAAQPPASPPPAPVGSGDPSTAPAGEPRSLEELRAEFPDWVIDKGLSGRYYAHRPADSPVLSGDDLLDTRDRILGWVRRHAWNERTTAGRVRALACTWCQAPAKTACDPQRGADHLLRYARARHAGLITASEHAAAIPDPSPPGAPMVTASQPERDGNWTRDRT